MINDLFPETLPQSGLIRLPLNRIKPGINPRTRFDEAKLAELAQGFGGSGPVQPLVVYLDPSDGMYGLIAGERRWKAAQLAKLKDIEVIVRSKPETKDCRKMALLENMQREDLTPLEIAWAVRDQLAEKTDHGVPVYNKAQLAAELGQDPAFISRCEALLLCSEKVQQSVHAKSAEFRVAAMIGTLPADMQEQAENEIIFRPAGPMTVDQAGRHIAENYRIDLRRANFDRKVKDLVPGRPACADCEFNGGRRSDVVGKFRDMVCLNPKCFEQKQLAIIQTVQAASDEGVGVRTLGQDQAERIFSFDGVTVKGESGYVAGDAKPDGIVLVDPKAKVPVWDKLLEGQELDAVYIVDGESRLRKLYSAELALQAVTATGGKFAALFKKVAAETTTTVRLSLSTVVANDQAAKLADAKKVAAEAAKAKGSVLAGQKWFTAAADMEMKSSLELVMLVVGRLTEAADQQWMAQVMSGSMKLAVPALDVIRGETDIGGCDELQVIALALIARTMRLQGPVGLPGITGNLCQLIGFDPKAEVQAIQSEVKAAEALVEKAAEVKAAAEAKKAEELHTCEKCGQANFTKRGLASHNCKRRQAKDSAALLTALKGGSRQAQPEAEAKAWEAYLATGSIAKAAQACGLDVESVKNWHKRRGWKAKRETALEAHKA